MQASALLRSRRFPEQALKSRSVKDEIRVYLIALLREGKAIFRGVIGYDAGDRLRARPESHLHTRDNIGQSDRETGSGPFRQGDS